MAINPRKRQQKLERRNAKRKEKKQLIRRFESGGIARQFAEAAHGAILNCWMSNSLDHQGIGKVQISRTLPMGLVAVASFLVDRYCLGVKDVMCQVLSRPQYAIEIAGNLPPGGVTPIEPADARKLIESVVAYARSLGLAPHADYDKARLIFGDIDASQSDLEFEFGMDGRPFFIAGPYDSLARCRRIFAALNHTQGPGNFDFLVPFAEFGAPSEDWEELQFEDSDEAHHLEGRSARGESSPG